MQQVDGNANAPTRPRWATMPFFSVLLVVAGLSSPLVMQWSFFPKAQQQQEQQAHKVGARAQSPGARIINVKARNVDVREVLQTCADQIGARLVLAQGVSGSISIEARDSKLEDVMDNLCTAYSCEWSVSEGVETSLVVRPSTL